MGSLLTTISEFFRDLRAQKLRTFLTIFGIIWGTVAIIVLLAPTMALARPYIIPDSDIEQLKKLGVGELFTPGAPTHAIVNYVRAWVGEHRN